MSFPRYESYKDSRIEWLGDVPEHWKTASLRWISKRYSGGTPDKLNLEYWTDGTIPWLNSGAVNEPIITEPSAYISEDALLKSSAKWVPKGALVMALAGQGKTKGMVAQLAIKTTCNQSMAAIITTEAIDARFLYWWLVTNYQNIRNLAGGDLRDGLNLELLGNIPCPLLPYQEQQTIKAFLDRETEKIDALITEQQRLIELLKEKRQSVISHAVTKGLNPNAPMKDSGIEWLGEVPKHWEVKRLKRLLRLLTEKTNRRDNPIALENIQGWSGRFIPTETEFEGEGIAFERGDILFGKLRPYLAKVYLTESSGEAVGDFHVMRPMPEINGRFVMHQILNRDFITIVNSSTFGAKMPRVAWDFMANMSLVIPPINEQQTITAFLDSETAKLDTLTAEAKTVITLLQERRTALISVAVTGKIDVRRLI